jgi:hypothetical protein
MTDLYHPVDTTAAEAAVCGMFLYEGYRDYRDKQGDSTDSVGGAIEQAEWLAWWADAIAGETRIWLMEHEQEDYPGVLAYEVWNPIGWELAVDVHEGTVPTRREMRDRVRFRLAEFFGQEG